MLRTLGGFWVESFEQERGQIWLKCLENHPVSYMKVIGGVEQIPGHQLEAHDGNSPEHLLYAICHFYFVLWIICSYSWPFLFNLIYLFIWPWLWSVKIPGARDRTHITTVTGLGLLSHQGAPLCLFLCYCFPTDIHLLPIIALENIFSKSGMCPLTLFIVSSAV